MKTSNKLMLGALVVLLVSLTVYNFALKAEYLSGNYKDPYAGYVNKNIKGFTEIEVNAINMMHVTIQQGDYAVRVSKTNTKLIQTGNQLIVDVDFAKKAASADPNVQHANDIIIYCPQLTYVKTDEYHYTIARKKMSDDQQYEVNRGGRSVNIHRFKLDSLSTEQRTGSLRIVDSKIGVLKSVAAARSRLTISDDTHIGRADMHINDHSFLTFERFDIPKFTYTLADSATITFTSKGNFFKGLMK